MTVRYLITSVFALPGVVGRTGLGLGLVGPAGLAGLAGLVGFTGCIPSNVVAVADRDVVLQDESVAWRPATVTDLPGLYRSERIEGAVAASVLKIYYYIDADGSFTGAALLATAPPRFEVVGAGRWTYTEGRLTLGEGAEPARIDAADGMLRLTGGEGAVVLYREVTR